MRWRPVCWTNDITISKDAISHWFRGSEQNQQMYILVINCLKSPYQAFSPGISVGGRR